MTVRRQRRPSDLAAALGFALRFEGRKRVHNADMSEIVARRLVEHLARRCGAWPWIRGVKLAARTRPASAQSVD